MKIVIDGNIGVGKTTLIKKLSKNFNTHLENILEWDSWLKEFYKNPKKNSLGFQMCVLLHHIKKKNCDLDKQIHILERSTISCNKIFGKLLVDDNLLSLQEYNLCDKYDKNFGWIPDYIIYIKTPPEICLNRIKKRNRKGENSISLDYLKKLHNKYEKLYNSNKYPVYIVNGNLDINMIHNIVLKFINHSLNNEL